MPLDKSIKKVLVIGSGPIVIGQAAEFDYSGTQACQAIKDEGIDVVLVNSNPATIMTDRGMATNTYIEPLTAEYVEKIIQKERPDSIIAGMGAETIIEILEAAPWVFDARYYLVLVPATMHSILRRWLARRGFALRAETLCQAAGRWYAVMIAQYTGAAREPDELFCLTGLTNGQPGCSEYYAVQNEKLKKYRLGLPEGTERDAVGELIAELDALAAR